MNNNLTERNNIERCLLCLVLNKNELIDILQIKPSYLSNKELAKLLEYCIETYKTYGAVNPIKIIETHKEYSLDLFTDILTNELFYSNSWREQLKICEDTILKNKKEDTINILSKKLNDKEITYDKYIQDMKSIDDIQLTSKAKELTILEMQNGINEQKERIELTDYPKLNNTLKLVQGDFLIVGATTGTGKSGLLLNLMNNLMDNYQCIYFNMEMSKSTIYKRIISIKSNVPIYNLNNPTKEEWDKITQAEIDIENKRIIIEHKASNIRAIKSVLVKAKDKDRHTILFVDHIGLINTGYKKSIYEQITEVAKQLRQICLEFDCTIICASQLNRGAYNSDVITLNMLKDSGELEQSASKVILLYRDKNDDGESIISKMDVDIAKNRDGIVGIVEMNYDKSKQIFREVEK